MVETPGKDAPSAAQNWAETVRNEHEQADAVRTDEPNTDYWNKLAHRFKPTNREQARQDETFIAVSRYVREGDTVLDVGAGAGRIALPLAEQCAHVTAVEPSETMRAQLEQQASDWELENFTVVAATWEEADVEQADVVVCAHVVYTVEQIEPFLAKLTASSKRDVLVVVFEEPAMANYFPLWKLVYGEERISLPSLPQLKEVLSEMRIEFETEPLAEWQSRPFVDFESAYRESLARLLISEGPDSAAHTINLRAALHDSLVPTTGGLHFKWARPHRPWMVHWGV